MDKNIYLNNSKKKLLEGIRLLNGAVSSTLGAGGKTVLIEDLYGGIPNITKDGVTVAREITINEDVSRIAVDLLKGVALKTNEEAGDGTTTSIVLAASLIDNDIFLSDRNMVNVVKGMRKASEDILAELEKLKIPVEDDFLKYIATISANNDPVVGGIIEKAFNEVGLKGLVKISNSKTSETTLEVDTGMQLDSGVMSSMFFDKPGFEGLFYEDANILITDHDIKNTNDLEKLIVFHLTENKPLVIICDNMSQQPLEVLINQKFKGGQVCVVKAPEYGDIQTEILQDIAIVTGGKLISKDMGMKLSDVTIEDLGYCERFESYLETSSFIRGGGLEEDVQNRINELKTFEGSKEEMKIKKDRAAKIEGGVAIINVGAWSDVERNELKDRYEDSINAVSAAIEEGVVPGGGAALYYCSNKINLTKTKNISEDYISGYNIVKKACKAPLIKILENAGLFYEKDYRDLLEIMSKNQGVDVTTGEKTNMIKAGIIDPYKVTRIAFRNAISVASTLFSTECVVSNDYTGTNHEQDINNLGL